MLSTSQGIVPLAYLLSRPPSNEQSSRAVVRNLDEFFGRPVLVSDLSLSLFVLWRRHLFEHGFKRNTVARYMSEIRRAWFRWMIPELFRQPEEGELASLADEIEARRASQPKPSRGPRRFQLKSDPTPEKIIERIRHLRTVRDDRKAVAV